MFALFEKFEEEGGLYSLRENSTSVIHYNLTNSPITSPGIYTTGYNYTYKYTLWFEEQFDPKRGVGWFIENFWLSHYFIAAYLLVIHLGRWYMQDRQAYDLRRVLFLWNVCLAVFSTWGALRTIPEVLYLVRNFGMSFTVCFTGKAFLENRVGGFWNWVFTLSKVPELGDTVFIVLRKQPLIFLHWYHHMTVLLYAWYSYPDYIATARWFVCMNYLVHSGMYSYYALRALRIRVPKPIAMTITFAQLCQMVMAVVISVWAYQVKLAGNECHVSYDNLKISFLMYASYFVLFAQFFRKAYIRRDMKPKELICKTTINNNYQLLKDIKAD